MSLIHAILLVFSTLGISLALTLGIAYAIFRMLIHHMQMPYPEYPDTNDDGDAPMPPNTANIVALELDLHGHLFCISPRWDIETSVREFNMFIDGVLRQMIEADTPEAYQKAETIKRNRAQMERELRQFIRHIDHLKNRP